MARDRVVELGVAERGPGAVRAREQPIAIAERPRGEHGVHPGRRATAGREQLARLLDRGRVQLAHAHATAPNTRSRATPPSG
jgi:hypothetical protein